jgi:hypothetical protein
MGEERNRVLQGKPEEKRPHGRPRHRWDQNGSWGDWLGVWSEFNWLRIGTGGRLL